MLPQRQAGHGQSVWSGWLICLFDVYWPICDVAGNIISDDTARRYINQSAYFMVQLHENTERKIFIHVHTFECTDFCVYNVRV